MAVWLLPRPADVDPRAWRLLAIFVATIVGLIAKPLPIGAVAFVGIAATLATNTLTLPEALSGFTNGPLWLVMTAFFLASGFIRTGLGERIAYILVSRFGRSTLGLGYSFVASDLVLAPMIPANTTWASSGSSAGSPPRSRRCWSASTGWRASAPSCWCTSTHTISSRA